MDIVLATLNARYTHASLGLRYLRANLGAYRERSVLCEFTIKRPPHEIVDEILALQPKLVGFGVYIWNTNQTLAVVRELRRRAPELMIVAGGPEISYETEGQTLTQIVDHVFQGEADFTFRDFVQVWFENGQRPAQRIVGPRLPEIDRLQLPYAEYSDEDIKNRTIYVEASRGCPYKCEYCLSSLDKSVRNFPLEPFLAALDQLIQRGARQFKFVDRTFNLAPSTSTRILQFFSGRQPLFLHFEMVPDRLPDELKELIQRFPAGSLQFEIGIQTWNPEVARHVSRRQDFTKVAENLRFLRSQTGVHTHTDLIVGLPGETRASFAAGFNRLFELQPDEIQVGILKRLKGTPIVRHDREFQMVYSAEPPFTILSTSTMSALEIREMSVFADFWDHVANSGRFPYLRDQAGTDPFAYFFSLAQWLFQRFGRTHSIHLRDLSAAIHEYLGMSSELGQVAVITDVSVLPKRQQRHALRSEA